MTLTLYSVKYFLCRKDVRIIIICTVTGGILQVLSKQYLKSHPEFLMDAPVTKGKYPRGGALIEISGISITIISQIVVNFIAKKGLLAGLATGAAVIISKIPATAVSTYLIDAFPQNLTDLDKKKFILVGREKKYISTNAI